MIVIIILTSATNKSLRFDIRKFCLPYGRCDSPGSPWCSTLAAHLSADTISYHCNGLPLCPSLHPLLPLLPLLPSVSFGEVSGPAFCCEEWAFGLSGTFSYLLCSKEPFGCGFISMEWSSLWAVVPSDGPPPKFYISSSSSLTVPGLGALRRYISLQNEWTREWMNEWRIPI